MMRFISKVFLIAYGAATHGADCPKPIAFDEGKVPPYMRSIRLPSHCDPNTIYRCRTGVLHVSKGLSYNGTNVVGIECVSDSDSRVKPRGRQSLMPSAIRNISNNASIGSSMPNRISEEAKSELKSYATAQGVPELILDRALANWEENWKTGKTRRGCFMAGDLTSKGQATLWLICTTPLFSIRTMKSHFAKGLGAGCISHIFRNNQCARFFGNRPGYCLPTGGRFVTQEVTQDNSSQRPFVELEGLDIGDNDNSRARRVGLHQDILHNGKPAKGSVNWFQHSQGCFTLPKDLPEFQMTDLSGDSEGGGVALYVYPSRSDVEKFYKTGQPEYWHASCRSEVSNPGWYGPNDYVGPGISRPVKNLAYGRFF